MVIGSVVQFGGYIIIVVFSFFIDNDRFSVSVEIIYGVISGSVIWCR